MGRRHTAQRHSRPPHSDLIAFQPQSTALCNHNSRGLKEKMIRIIWPIAIPSYQEQPLSRRIESNSTYAPIYDLTDSHPSDASGFSSVCVLRRSPTACVSSCKESYMQLLHSSSWHHRSLACGLWRFYVSRRVCGQLSWGARSLHMMCHSEVQLWLDGCRVSKLRGGGSRDEIASYRSSAASTASTQDLR
ncbi:hypothetical protein CC86DRAFT_367887 [Ophiobolus disseminans]|uniref:Uncharacterized protein n=1 Tax=Ophiobolus disseminans TaxID=1469910 RepID=A0A6A7AAW6_9PLEO|nr:hypothetical protein CC86DRAFT_367887 [Ophiobolus disseminans]